MRKALKAGTIIKFTRATTPFKKGQVGVVVTSKKLADGRTFYRIRPTVGLSAWVQRNRNMTILDTTPVAHSTPKFNVRDRVTVTKVLQPILGTRYQRGDSGVITEVRTSNSADPVYLYHVAWDKGGRSTVVGQELTKQPTPPPTPKTRLGYESLSGSRLVTSVLRPDDNIELTLSRPEGAARLITTLGLTPEAAKAVIKVLQAVL